MNFDTLDLVDELANIIHNPYIAYENPNIALKEAMKNILKEKKDIITKEYPISEESIELFRKEMQEHAFAGENNFSINHPNLFSIINQREFNSFLKWCKENDIEITTNVTENNIIVYTFVWEN